MISNWSERMIGHIRIAQTSRRGSNERKPNTAMSNGGRECYMS